MWHSAPLLFWTLSLVGGTSDSLESERIEPAAHASPLQSDSAPAADPEPPASEAPAPEPAPSDAEPPASEAPADAVPTEPAAPDAEPGTDEPLPEDATGVREVPDAEPAPGQPATDPAPTDEPRTWNDPTAAIAAAEANPNPHTTTLPEDDLGSEPLGPAPAKDPKGFGMTMVGAITYSPESGHAWAAGGCPSATITVDGTTQYFVPSGCSASPAAGISGEGRFGYMLSFIGFELYGQIATDYVNARLEGIPAIPGVPDYATQMHIGRIGIGGGGHVRFKTAPGPFRLSAGAGGGFLVRALFSNVSSLDGSSDNYVAPVLRTDVGIVLAHVLTLGFMGWLEFAPTVTVTPDLSSLGADAGALQNVLTDTVVMRGTQGFIGVFGGLTFGK